MLKPGLGLKIASLRVDTKDDPDRVAAPPQLVHLACRAVGGGAIVNFCSLENKGRVYLSPEERAAIEERLRKRATTIADPVRALSGHSEIGPGKRSGPRNAQNTRPRHFPLPSPTSRGPDPAAAEPRPIILVAILLMHPEFFHKVEDAFGQIEFPTERSIGFGRRSSRRSP